MRIVLVTEAAPPQVNGVVITLNALSQELVHAGHDVRWVTPALCHTVPCPTYPEIRLSLWPYRRVRDAIDHAQPDSIHIATEGPLGMAARRLCMERAWSFTTAYHTRFPEYLRARAPVPLGLVYAWLRRFHAAAARVMVPTVTMQDTLAQRGFGNTVIWPRGVDIGRFKPDGARAFTRPHPVFMYVGRVAVEKNLSAFLDLELPGEKWVVGGGPQLAFLKRRYPDVHFAGPKAHHELPQWYRSADVFVFPSRTDTFGLVLLEALACGVPVAAYPVPGPQDVIDAGGGAGVLDTDLRSAAIQALSLGGGAARRHATRFSWPRVAQLFADYLVPLRLAQAGRVVLPQPVSAAPR